MVASCVERRRIGCAPIKREDIAEAGDMYCTRRTNVHGIRRAEKSGPNCNSSVR